MDKMHRFSVDNIMEMKHDAYAKGKIAMELNNNYGEFECLEKEMVNEN